MKNFLVILVVGLIVFFSTYSYFNNKYRGTNTAPIHDTIYQTKDSIKYIPKDSIIYRDKKTHNPIVIVDTFRTPNLVDTNAIIAAFIVTRLYKDTVFKDSIGYVFIIDSVKYNRIISRQKFINIHVARVVPVSKRPRPMVLIGCGVGYTATKFGISIKSLYMSPSKITYGISYDFINKYWEASLYFPIRLHKK